MSVLIKGMEMPGSCYYCPFADGSWGYSPPHKKRCLISGKDMPVDERYVQKNQPVCPLVPVPPHGRLIDADALRQSIKESIDECHKWAEEVEGGEMYARVSQSLGTFVECSLRVKAAPTIIPAEEEEG